MLKRTLLFTVVCMLAAFSLSASAQEQVYHEGWLSGCDTRASLETTCTHRLDITVNQPLAAITWKGGLQPLLAESWEMQEDGKIWIFHLRQGVKWHDGEPFTADDVVFSFNAYANPEVASRWTGKASSILGYKEFQEGQAQSLSGVTAIDDHTVRIELNQAMPLWINLEQIYIVILPEHILGDVPAKDLIAHEYWRNRVGTGPFKWEEYKEGQYISIVRNEDFFLGAPKLEKIVYHIYSDATTQVAALEGGEIDTIAYETTLVSVNDVERLDAVDGIDVVIMEKGSPTFMSLNHKREWKDKRLRQALRYGIDVKTILETIYPGARPAYTMFPQDWAVPDDLNTYEFDPEKAKQLLQEAGWSGREVDLPYHYGDELNQNLIIAMQQYLADIGIKLVPRKMDPSGIRSLYDTPDYDTGYLALGMGVDPATGENNVRSGELLSFGYSNPKVDELFTKGKALSSREERAPIYQEISRILNEDMPKVWLWYDIRPLAFNRRVVGPYEHWNEQKIIYFNLPVYNEIEKWYIK